jgi:hypothetical protein
MVEAGCRDCTLRSQHRTRTEALMVVRDHVLETGHWPMIADNNGWHYIMEEVFG